MTAPTLWIEITIAGAVYLAGIAFFILSILGLKDLQALAAASTGYLPYIAACGVAASYIVGIVAHRTIQVLARPVLARVERLLGLPELTSRIPADVSTSNNVALWQYGSARLHREIDFQYALVALIRSLLFSLPLLGVTWSAWLKMVQAPAAWLPAAFAAIGWPVVYAAYRRQWSQYRNLQSSAWTMAESIAALTRSPVTSTVQDANGHSQAQ